MAGTSFARVWECSCTAQPTTSSPIARSHISATRASRSGGSGGAPRIAAGPHQPRDNTSRGNQPRDPTGRGTPLPSPLRTPPWVPRKLAQLKVGGAPLHHPVPALTSPSPRADVAKVRRAVRRRAQCRRVQLHPPHWPVGSVRHGRRVRTCGEVYNRRELPSAAAPRYDRESALAGALLTTRPPPWDPPAATCLAARRAL